VGKLKGKVAIVTGASRGIGKAISTLFASEGASVVCAARTLNEGEHILEGSLSATIKEICNAGGKALAVQSDVSSEESCNHLVETARQQFGPVDILVNNAGISYFSMIKDIPLKFWKLGFAVNVQGPFMLSQKVLPDMIARKSGTIINVSSLSALGSDALPDKIGNGDTMYAATKAALNRLTEGLAKEVSPYGISVISLSPLKIVITPGTLYHKIVAGENDPDIEAPEIMARAALLLATASPDKISGRIVISQKILEEFGWI
jgi:citronellol/citronellal dehydrogenase